MRTSDFSFNLPRNLIAQRPASPRDSSRLFVIDRKTGSFTHDVFRNLPQYLNAGDVLVLNNSKVVPFRLHGLRVRKEGGSELRAHIELLLLKEVRKGTWEALVKPLKKLREGDELIFGKKNEIRLTFKKRKQEVALVSTSLSTKTLLSRLQKVGEMPTPPYITKQLRSRSQYQTTFARVAGSAAAPTAGLHFTKKTFLDLSRRQVSLAHTTLHVGLGTFQPIAESSLESHRMHSERIFLTPQEARKLNQAKQKHQRVIAVGTTSLRTLESLATSQGGILPTPKSGQETDIFIKPGYSFLMTDGLLTNFHLPQSTLFVLVCAFAGTEVMKHAYQEAIRLKYRFFSFGDAMLIL